MQRNRFSQLRNLGLERQEIAREIRHENKKILEKWDNNLLKEYISHLLLEKDFQMKDFENLKTKMHVMAAEKIDYDATVLQFFSKLLTEKILLPDYIDPNNKRELFAELDKILERANIRVENIISGKNAGEFFNILFSDIKTIQSDFVRFGNLEPYYFHIGGIFGEASIENGGEEGLHAMIPVRLSDKKKQNSDGMEDFGAPSIPLKKVEAVLKTLADGKNGNYTMKEQFKGYKIGISTEKIQDKKRRYGKDSDDTYLIIKIFTEDQDYLDDDISEKEMANFLQSILTPTSILVNTLANKSEIPHRPRIFNLNTGEFFDDFTEEDFNGKTSGLTKEENERFEQLKVKMTEKVKIDEIGGQPKAKEEILKIIKSLKYEDVMKAWGARPTTGIVFEWPAGTGKTLLAKAVASEINAEVYNIKLTDIASSAYINEGSNNVKKLFTFIREKSKKGRKIVVILDELDALFIKRGNGRNSGEDTKIVNTFLTEMSGLESLENVIFIGTTNLIDNIDPAVIRSGRLTTKVKVDKPDREGLLQILQIHIDKLKKKSRKFLYASEKLDLEKLVSHCDGLSGADIEEIVRILAEKMAMREIAELMEGRSPERVESISDEDFIDAVSRVKSTSSQKGIGFLANI